MLNNCLNFRKYSTSDKLAYLVTDVVEETVKIIKQKEGINKAFSPYDYIYLLFFNILASSVFDKRYAFSQFSSVQVLSNYFES